MSIPNYKVVVQIEFKPRVSLICFLKQGTLLIRKIYAAFFPGSICGGSHQRVITGSQVQKTQGFFDLWGCLPSTPHIYNPCRGQRWRNVSHQIVIIKGMSTCYLEYAKYMLLYLLFLLAYRYTQDIGSLDLCSLYSREIRDN